jgi:hypothetical protein
MSNIATPLTVRTKELQQQSLIRFLWSESVKTGEIYWIMTIQYGDNCVSQGKVWAEGGQVVLVMRVLGDHRL